ncbi:BQ5605_C005g03293 [Microbotryum silenes-dioicae]|uniref:BQ5605_C005g03293 protein n=1 Tax=Microbotryum silenes-dioicae TaxID=796604 RepID=A0A2X0P5Q2_9BASI|nr:BQ5605_C005g03293 [Microbotryum silenes-dioicae]
MVNSEVSLKPLLATNVPMIFTLLVSINFTETGHCFVSLRDILEEVAELTGLALQEDSCFDYWVVDNAATSSTHSTPCLASCRYDQLAAFTAATDSSDKVLGLTGFVLDIDSLPAEATITLRVYEHIKARLPFVNITTRPKGREDAPVPSGAPSASKHDLLVREKRETSPSDRISGNLRPNTEPYSTDDKLVNSEDHANLPTYSEGRTTMTDLMLEAYPQEIVLDPWRPNGTWGDVLIVRMDPGSSGGLSHMWAFSASSSRTDSKGRWKGPRLDANVEYSKYSKKRCMGVFVCCDQSCPGKRRPHTSLSTASRSKLFQEETPQLVTGRPKKAATRKHLAPNVERPSDELPPCPITSCNGPMRHILCSATIARGQREECPGEIYIWHSGYHLHPPPLVSRPSPQHLEELRQLRKAAPQASAAELRMGQMTAFPQDPRHRPSASEICPVFDSTRSISRYAPRVGHSKRNGALPDTLMSAIEAVANAGCLAYIEIPGQRQGQPLAEQIHDPDPRKQPRNDGSRSKSKITSNSLTDSETSFGIQTPQMKARLSETIDDRLVEGNLGWPTDAHNTYFRDNWVLLATVCYSPSARRWFPILYSVGNHERSGFYRRHFAYLFQILDDANYSVEDIVNGVTFVVDYSSAQISGLRQAISDWYVARKTADVGRLNVTPNQVSQWTAEAIQIGEKAASGCAFHFIEQVRRFGVRHLSTQTERERFAMLVNTMRNAKSHASIESMAKRTIDEFPELNGSAERCVATTTNAVESSHWLLIHSCGGKRFGPVEGVMRLIDFAKMTDRIESHATDGYVRSSTYHEQGNVRAHIKEIKSRNRVPSSYVSDANMPEPSISFAAPARLAGIGFSESPQGPSDLSKGPATPPLSESTKLPPSTSNRSRQQPKNRSRQGNGPTAQSMASKKGSRRVDYPHKRKIPDPPSDEHSSNESSDDVGLTPSIHCNSSEAIPPRDRSIKLHQTSNSKSKGSPPRSDFSGPSRRVPVVPMAVRALNEETELSQILLAQHNARNLEAPSGRKYRIPRKRLAFLLSEPESQSEAKRTCTSVFDIPLSLVASKSELAPSKSARKVEIATPKPASTSTSLERTSDKLPEDSRSAPRVKFAPPKTSTSTSLGSTIVQLHADFWLRSGEDGPVVIIQGPWSDDSCWIDSTLIALLSVANGLGPWLQCLDILNTHTAYVIPPLGDEMVLRLRPRYLALELWDAIREYTALARKFDMKPAANAIEAYTQLRERMISTVVGMSKERGSHFTTPFKRGSYSSPVTWLETLHSFTVDHPVLPSAVTLNDPDRTLVELHLQRAGYCTACNCIQIEVSPRRQFVVDWPLLISSFHLPSHSLETLSDVLASIVGQPLKLYTEAKNSGRRHHKRNCPGGSYVQFVSITSLPRVIVININNIYPEHPLAPAELRFGVSDQMPEMVWRLRSGVYNINNSHFVTNATVGYGQEAACYHFDAIKGSLARPIGDRNAGGLVSVLFYELEEESLNFLQAFNLMLTRQWHEMGSLYHEPSDPTDIGIKVSSLPPKGTLEEGQGVWKMEDASAFFHECEIVSVGNAKKADQ